MDSKSKRREDMERELLERGTAMGPVTPELVALAKSICLEACVLDKMSARKAAECTADYWPDFITPARERLKARS